MYRVLKNFRVCIVFYYFAIVYVSIYTIHDTRNTKHDVFVQRVPISSLHPHSREFIYWKYSQSLEQSDKEFRINTTRNQDIWLVGHCKGPARAFALQFSVYCSASLQTGLKINAVRVLETILFPRDAATVASASAATTHKQADRVRNEPMSQTVARDP